MGLFALLGSIQFSFVVQLVLLYILFNADLHNVLLVFLIYTIGVVDQQTIADDFEVYGCNFDEDLLVGLCLFIFQAVQSTK